MYTWGDELSFPFWITQKFAPCPDYVTPTLCELITELDLTLLPCSIENSVIQNIISKFGISEKAILAFYGIYYIFSYSKFFKILVYILKKVIPLN